MEERQRAREEGFAVDESTSHRFDELSVAFYFTYSSKQVETKVIALFKDGKKVDAIDDEGEIMKRLLISMRKAVAINDSGTLENDNMSESN